MVIYLGILYLGILYLDIWFRYMVTLYV